MTARAHGHGSKKAPLPRTIIVGRGVRSLNIYIVAPHSVAFRRSRSRYGVRVPCAQTLEGAARGDTSLHSARCACECLM